MALAAPSTPNGKSFDERECDVSEQSKGPVGSDESAGAVLRSLPLLLKAWLIIGAALYVAAKIHTWSTIGKPGFIERHWPFWAALLGWGVLLWAGQGVAYLLARRRRRRTGCN